MKFQGHPSWPKGASRQGERACLRPKAEFARLSGRGLRRVWNFIQDAKGMYKNNPRTRAHAGNLCLNLDKPGKMSRAEPQSTQRESIAFEF